MIRRAEEMELFVAAVEHGSLTKAAQQCGMSLASASRYVSALEERLGVRLLLRSTRALSLTEAGQRYYASAKQLLNDMDAVDARVMAESGLPVGRIRISAPTLWGRAYLLPLLGEFLTRHEQVSLDVLLIDRPVSLIDEGIDIAILVGEQPDSSLVARKLGQIRWVLFAAPGYLAQHGVPDNLRALGQHACLVYSQHMNMTHWTLMHDGKPKSIEITSRLHANNLDAVVAAALAGAGIAYAPAWAVQPYVEDGRLQVVLPSSEMPARPLYAVMPQQRLLAAKVRYLLDFMVQAFDDRLG